METNQISEKRKIRKNFQGHQGHDPLRAVWRQSRVFNTSWFKDGESLSLVQRTGYMMLSLAFVGGALYLFADAAEGFRGGDSTFWLSAIGGMCFAVVGAVGLRNVLRFKVTGAKQRGTDEKGDTET
jgi:hypothetical protein